ncbi:MAG: acetate kinase [Acidimicrobiia bacterium]|nr:acetate kinase [Acidimicrobiia bacterium]
MNAGSSTLKLSLIAHGGDTLAATTIESWDGQDVGGIESFVNGRRVSAVGHRVVHGGTRFTRAERIDDVVRSEIESLAALAPLHQAAALAGIDAVRRLLPEVPAVACFDSAFHASMPLAAATYAVPEAWRERWAIRRFGFHGLAHEWAARRTAQLLQRPLESMALVTCHLGSGASLCAIDGGRSVDTTMGFTPLEGLVMSTRSGTVDPGLVLWLLSQGLTAAQVNDGLEHHGGLLALAGTGDMREVLAAREAGSTRAAEAFDVYIHRLCREAGGMVAALGRLDALVFTGGVGEHSPAVRSAVINRLGFLGLHGSEAANDHVNGDAVLSAPDAPVAVVVVAAREDLEMARQVDALLAR